MNWGRSRESMVAMCSAADEGKPLVWHCMYMKYAKYTYTGILRRTRVDFIHRLGQCQLTNITNTNVLLHYRNSSLTMDDDGPRNEGTRNSLTVVCGMSHYLVDRTIFGPSSFLFCSIVDLFWLLSPFWEWTPSLQLPAPLPTNKHYN